MIEVKLGELADEQLDLIAGGTGNGNITANGASEGHPHVSLFLSNSSGSITRAELMSGRDTAGRGTDQH